MSAPNGFPFDHRALGGIFTPQRKLKVICVGAGASGLLLAYKVQRHFDDFELKVFEKNPEVGSETQFSCVQNLQLEKSR